MTDRVEMKICDGGKECENESEERKVSTREKQFELLPFSFFLNLFSHHFFYFELGEKRCMRCG